MVIGSNIKISSYYTAKSISNFHPVGDISSLWGESSLQKPPQNVGLMKVFRPGARGAPFSPETRENV